MQITRQGKQYRACQNICWFKQIELWSSQLLTFIQSSNSLLFLFVIHLIKIWNKCNLICSVHVLQRNQILNLIVNYNNILLSDQKTERVNKEMKFSPYLILLINLLYTNVELKSRLHLDHCHNQCIGSSEVCILPW